MAQTGEQQPQDTAKGERMVGSFWSKVEEEGGPEGTRTGTRRNKTGVTAPGEAQASAGEVGDPRLPGGGDL